MPALGVRSPQHRHVDFVASRRFQRIAQAQRYQPSPAKPHAPPGSRIYRLARSDALDIPSILSNRPAGTRMLTLDVPGPLRRIAAAVLAAQSNLAVQCSWPAVVCAAGQLDAVAPGPARLIVLVQVTHEQRLRVCTPFWRIPPPRRQAGILRFDSTRCRMDELTQPPRTSRRREAVAPSTLLADLRAQPGRRRQPPHVPICVREKPLPFICRPRHDQLAIR